MSVELGDEDNEIVTAQMGTRLIMDTLRSVNWFKMKRVNIKVHRNRKRAGRSQHNIRQATVMGTETITITITTGPSGISKRADGLMGNWTKRELLNVFNAASGRKTTVAEEDGNTNTERE